LQLQEDAMTHCDTYIQTLRDLGYRITPQREMILQAMAHCQEHMTADEILAEVQQKTSSVNITTIYRTLDLLVAEGIVNMANLWDGRSVYTTSQHGAHIHAVCRVCGASFEIKESLLALFASEVKEQYNFDVDINHISISGVCSKCHS
jgi:Fur family ferric uptake transcriptional regulator